MTRHYSLLFVLLASVGLAEPPVFDPPVALDAGGVPINVGYGGNASPFVVDWDGDLRRDLLLGQYNLGKVRFYHNEGEDTAPRFDTFE